MSVTRITGFASGFDTESIIKSLMKAERAKVDKYNQNQQVLKWKQQLYNDVNKDFANFILDTRKEFGIDSISSTSKLAWGKKATSSNDSAISATALSTATTGTHTIEVTQLAKGVTAASGSTVENKTLKDLLGIGEDDTYEISINGKPITFTGKDDLTAVAKKINAEVPGVKASYDTTAKRFFINTTTTGSQAELTIDDTAGSLLAKLDLKVTDQNATAASLVSGTSYKGQQAKINYNGATGIAYDTNQITINGLQLELKQVSGPQTIKVDTDVDGVYNKIKGFVDKYNELVDKLNTLTSEKQYRDYKPLTDEQKESMSEKEIELWEEKAKSGLLRSNTYINKTLQDVRQGLYEPVAGVTGAFNELFDIGITTGDYKQKGKLVIDETKLKEAITKDADGVIDLLLKQPSVGANEETKRKESGLINRMYDSMITGMKEIVSQAGIGDNSSLYSSVKAGMLVDFISKQSGISYLEKSITDVGSQISREEDRLASKEESYWKKFTAMEKAMQKMQSQSTWLSQQLG
ncbi:flagellar hook-associated protein 2 [Anaerosolibacter carboniphilus]|uniref:Flagellar hook-associated protein 2 n=1 Tax=Anaerosolibacter carboniphilus TaxID=1417629 RepID=A0A841KSR4_9FIRM|nr:flagellar filament capping protein FliD [Anaerosolibacter carboniphilus]MBB6216441.1 flagellar hook-associated protein 2 [Anaerosolibacter carboniphilus]